MKPCIRFTRFPISHDRANNRELDQSFHQEIAMFIVLLVVAAAAVAVPAYRALRRLLRAVPASNADFSPF